MIPLILSAVFKQRALYYQGQQQEFNYMFKEYNPLVTFVLIDPPADANATYIFQHAQRKIDHLEIRGDFGKSEVTGLIWSQPTTRIFDVIFEMTVVDSARFSVVQHGIKFLVSSSFFDVGQAVIYMDTVGLASVTKSSLICRYLLCGGTPGLPFIREDRMYASGWELPVAPEEFAEACAQCPPGSGGKGCNECVTGLYEDNELCEEDPSKCGCLCLYSHYNFNEFYSKCVGEPIFVGDPILLPDGETRYFMDCVNHESIRVNFYNNSLLDYSYEMFKNDECGLNNLLLDLNLYVNTASNTEHSIAGLVPMQTRDLSTVDYLIEIYNGVCKLQQASMLFHEPTPRESFVLENVIIKGNFTEGGYNRNYSEGYHVNTMYSSVRDANISVSNLSVLGAVLKTSYDGTYCSFGVGIANNAVFNVKYLYIGDLENNTTNPMTLIDPEELDDPSVHCDEKMSMQLKMTTTLYQLMPPLFEYNKLCQFNLGGGPKAAGFLGKMLNSELNIERSLIAAEYASTNSNSIGFAVLTFDLINSQINTTFCILHGHSKVIGPSGVIGVMSGPLSLINLEAAVNLTSTKNISGTIGIMEQGITNIEVYLNMKFAGNYTGGLIGQMEGGILNVKGAFGSVGYGPQFSYREVGYWTAGQIDNETCIEDVCEVEFPENSYINVKDDSSGNCASKAVVTEPVGSPADMYFYPCKSNVKLKIEFNGTISKANLSVMQTMESCVLKNVVVKGELIIMPDNIVNVSGVVRWNYNDISRLTVDLIIVENMDKLRYCSFVSLNATGGPNDVSASNILITSRLTQIDGRTKVTRAAGLFCDNRNKLTLTNISFLGVEMTVGNAEQMAFVLSKSTDTVFASNILIDCYRSVDVFPNFENPPTNAAFPCPDIMGEGHKLATRFAGFLKPSSRPSFMKDILNKTSASGALIGQMSHEFSVINVSANISAYISSTGSFSNGALLGNLYGGTLTAENIYITGASEVEFGGIMGYGYTHYQINAVVEYTFKKPKSALVMKLTTSTSYNMTFSLLVNLTLEGDNSAGIFYEKASSVKDSIFAGIIRKNGNNQYNYDYTRKLDDADNGNVINVSNTETCPLPP